VPLRPVTPVRLVDSAGQAGGYNNCTENVPGSLSDFLGLGTKPHQKTQPAREENPTQNLAKLLETCQELTISNTRQQGTHQDVHPRQLPQKACTGQTGHTWAARDE
jgi:hypothetical protein